jgi:DnaJ-class molecular chaperone
MTESRDRREPFHSARGDASIVLGDEAPPGTSGTGEDVCPECAGSGRRDGDQCATCLGRGRVVKAISGGP